MHETTRPDPLLRFVLLGAGLVVIAAGLRAAAPLVNAFLLAALLALTLLPAKQALVRRGVGKGPAILIVLATVVVGGALLVTAVASAIADFSANAPQYEKQLADVMARGQAFLGERGVDVTALAPSASAVVGIAQAVVGGVLAALGWSLLGLVLIALLMLELPLPEARQMKDLELQARLADIYSVVQRYMTINGAVAGGAAVANLVVMWIAGTEHAVLWAVVGFLLAFVPFGFIVSAIPPVALTALESGGGWAAVVFVAFVVINSVADNVIKPKFMGDDFGIPFSVIALAFLGWGFVLGAFGALLAVPLTLALMKAAPLLRRPAT